jgi:hypothetical protein
MAFFVLGVNPKNTQTINPQPAFLGPAVRGFFQIAGRVFNFTGRFFDQNTRLGRTFVKIFGPFSVPVQTTRTVTGDVIAEILQGIGIDVATQQVLIPYIKDHYQELFSVFFERNADGSIELDVTPGWFTDP